MRFTKEQMMQHPKRVSLLGIVNTKKQNESTGNEQVIEKNLPKQADVTLSVYKSKAYTFSIKGAPMGKPRMTQRDKWMKRECVVRYRQYCDRLRAAAGKVPEGNAYGICVLAWMAMPESWSKKKKQAMAGKIVQQKPDWDNVAKAVCDALFEDDSVLGGGTCWKFWCEQSQEKTVVTVLLN
jgi:Holliday junction resolvase RusA-like endonuclease